MDFNGQYQFPASHQPAGYNPFMSVPPLTPSHSAPSDDYNNSPPEAFDAIPANDQFRTFEYAQAFHQPPSQNPGFPGRPGPPTPPTHPAFGQQHPPTSNGIHSDGAHIGAIASQPKSEPEDGSNGRGGSDEDNMTPAQSKRKAQNRAAQRAFRERKEKHVKDLEAKLANLEAAQQQTSVENERLKRDLQNMATENEILKATGASANAHNTTHSPEPLTTGPMRYSPTDFASKLLASHDNKTFSHRIAFSNDGQRLLAAGASWDLIIGHELYKQGLVDIASVSDHLKTRAVCDGQGPVFSEKDVLEAIQASVANGSDDLL